MAAVPVLKIWLKRDAFGTEGLEPAALGLIRQRSSRVAPSGRRPGRHGRAGASPGPGRNTIRTGGVVQQ